MPRIVFGRENPSAEELMLLKIIEARLFE